MQYSGKILKPRLSITIKEAMSKKAENIHCFIDFPFIKAFDFLYLGHLKSDASDFDMSCFIT